MSVNLYNQLVVGNVLFKISRCLKLKKFGNHKIMSYKKSADSGQIQHLKLKKTFMLDSHCSLVGCSLIVHKIHMQIQFPI